MYNFKPIKAEQLKNRDFSKVICGGLLQEAAAIMLLLLKINKTVSSLPPLQHPHESSSPV